MKILAIIWASKLVLGWLLERPAILKKNNFSIPTFIGIAIGINFSIVLMWQLII